MKKAELDYFLMGMCDAIEKCADSSPLLAGAGVGAGAGYLSARKFRKSISTLPAWYRDRMVAPGGVKTKSLMAAGAILGVGGGVLYNKLMGRQLL